MISVIICSRTAELPADLKNNIASTIGVEFEIISVDNSKNKLSIFEAYNLGVAKSQYPFLCFMHDDIYYHTQKWGIKVAEHFSDAGTGAIGVAGSPYATQMPGSWWGGQLINQYMLPVDVPLNKPIDRWLNERSADGAQVVLLDGIWLCIRRSIFGKISFDAKTYSGYHFYDTDISMQIAAQGYKLKVVGDVLVSHLSKGMLNRNWCENAMLFQGKWQHSLPYSCVSLSYRQRCLAELRTLREYTAILRTNGYPAAMVNRLGMAKIATFYKGYLFPNTAVHFFKYLINFFNTTAK